MTAASPHQAFNSACLCSGYETLKQGSLTPGILLVFETPASSGVDYLDQV